MIIVKNVCLGVGVLAGHDMLRAYIGPSHSGDYGADQSESCEYHDEMLRVLKHCKKLLYFTINRECAYGKLHLATCMYY